MTDYDKDMMTTDFTKPGLTLEGGQGEALKFAEFYAIEQQKLGSGAYGTVYVTKHKNSGEEYAVKVIDRRYVYARKLAISRRERNTEIVKHSHTPYCTHIWTLLISPLLQQTQR